MNAQLLLTDPLVGIIYLLHFTRAYKHARHYTGWTPDLGERLRKHRQGQGARLIAVITAAGIDFQLARTCLGTRADERAIKHDGGATRYCPLCVPHPWRGHWGDDTNFCPPASHSGFHTTEAIQ